MTQVQLLVSANDGTATPAGYVGERKLIASSTRTTLPSTTGNVGTLTLSAGLWDVTLYLQIYGNTMTNASNVQILAYPGAATNTSAWSIEGLTQINTYALFNSSNNLQIPLSVTCRTRSDGTNLYLIGSSDSIVATSNSTQNIQCNFNNGYTSGAANPTYTYSLTAIRIA